MLREAGIEARILVMAGFSPRERKALLDYRLTRCCTAFRRYGTEPSWRASESSLAFPPKVDSGMGRLGTRAGPGERS